MEGKLTVKMEKFAQEYISCGSASQAYRSAYDTENMKQKTVWEEACRLLKHPKVSARILEITCQNEAKSSLTRDFITEKLLYILDQRETCSVDLIRRTCMDLARLHGLLVEKRNVDINHTYMTMPTVTIDDVPLEFDIGS